MAPLRYPQAMRALVIEQQAQAGKAASVFRVVEDHPEPEAPPPGWVLVRTEASALNHMDLWVAMNAVGFELTYPRVSGCDACGVVEQVGEGVDDAWLGRRVIFNAAIRQPDRVHPDDPTDEALAPAYELIGEHSDGAHRERFVAPAANLQDVGDADPIAAAAFGLVHLTAWGMVRKAELAPSQRVLITGVGGGVATALLGLVRHLGCPAAVTSRREWKLDRARDLGAALTILDEGQDWAREVRRWTGKRGVEAVFDSVGKAVLPQALASLARGGAFVTCGATSGPVGELHLGRVFWNQLRVLGSTMGSNDEFAQVCA
ncbi:MAG: hypothetical protein D6824_01730, partial [Planctomycetota bacterium]